MRWNVVGMNILDFLVSRVHVETNVRNSVSVHA